MVDKIPTDRRKNDEELMKKAAKEAIREFLDEKFTVFGRWSFYSLLALGLVAMVYFILLSQGWHLER